jgi:DNA-binding response OmpR family regulator
MKGKILVVDDEVAMRDTLADIFRQEGYQVHAAESGAAALEVIEEGGFDVMVLDLKMPGMDGMEVMSASHQLAPDTQIIVLTAHGSLESAIEGIRHEVHDYLLKPVNPEMLVASLNGAMEQREDLRRKRRLLHQMESSLQQLKGVEGVVAPPPLEQQVVSLPDSVMVDLTRREIWRGNERVTLTPTEGALMKVLLDSRGRVLTHRELVYRVQGYETTEEEAPEVLRPLVSRLRRKLSLFGGENWIVNVRGTGYLFEGIKEAVG